MRNGLVAATLSCGFACATTTTAAPSEPAAVEADVVVTSVGVEIRGQQVVKLDDGTIHPNELSHNGWAIDPVATALSSWQEEQQRDTEARARAAPAAAGQSTTNTPDRFATIVLTGPVLTIAGPPTMRYRLLAQLTYTAGRAGFRLVDLVVTGSTERARLTLPSLKNPRPGGEPLNLAVHLEEDQSYRLSASRPLSPEREQTTDRIGTAEALQQRLREIKAIYRREERIIVVPTVDTPYAAVVRVIEICRAASMHGQVVPLFGVAVLSAESLL